MESNGLSGGMFSNMDSGMLGLEMSLQQRIPQQNLQRLQQQPHHPMVGSSHFEAAEHHPTYNQLLSVKQGYPSYPPKSKNQQLTHSDEDDPGVATENSADDENRQMCPWQRMKWADGMVKLLIMMVYYIGDEVGSEGNDPNVKKKTGGVLQKKGKWKSVSRAMMERGFYVSPQQCEDKFNDLNKRYKRVNDILGKGTACRVVENQSLLETMDHLSPKIKEEVKKLLNSKHLFFREMCAYHNSCNHGSGDSRGGAHQSPEIAAEPSQTQQQTQQQKCLHSSENASNVPGSGKDGRQSLKLTTVSGEKEEDSEDDVGDDNDDDDEDEDEVEGSARSHEQGHEAKDDADGKSSWKRRRKGIFIPPSIQKLRAELTSVVQDGTKSPVEKRQWMRIQLLQLEQQLVGYECLAFELEKQRLEWRKFSNKKEREMEREKLTNEQTRLENERMVLLLHQKELELIDFQQQQQQQSSNKQ